MKNLKSPTRLVAVGLACAGLGAGGSAVLNASAQDSGGKNAKAAKYQGGKRNAQRAGKLLRRVVHGDLVVRMGGGTFGKATIDRGRVTARSGDSITLAEGGRKATYKTVTLTIPATARVRDNRAKAALADVEVGQQATVLRLPKRTVVQAHDMRDRGR